MMHTEYRSSRRSIARLLHVLFVLVIVAAPDLPVLFPAPVAAATVDSAAKESIDPGSAIVESSGEPDAASSIEASDAKVLSAAQKSASDLWPAYLNTVDLGGGERAAVISSEPVRYLSPDGEWMPIDPRFTPEIDGFSNMTNLMTVHAGARQAVLEVNHGALAARWTPQALLLTQDNHEVILAKPRPAQGVEGILAADGRTVHYADSWTMVGMADEVVAGAGEAEHSVLFAQAPSLNGETAQPNSQLVMRARLELPPGGQLWVGGVQQAAAFTTTGVIELRDHEGTTQLNLSPATIFEQARPQQSLIAIYHVIPIDVRSWEVRMETPLAWWLDPARQYPVVWDPMMQVLRALEVAQIFSNPACTDYVQNIRPGTTGVGRATCDLFGFRHYSPVRTLLRFTKMESFNLPPGAEIQGGILLVAPTDGYINYTSLGQFDPCVNTQLHRVTGPWNPAAVNWGNQPPVDPSPFRSSSTSYAGRTDPPLCFSTYSSGPTGTKYILQDGPAGIVSDWISGNNNFGLELRGTPAEENGCDLRYGCDYVQIPARSTWQPSDKDQLFNNDFERMAGGGFMLIVRYKGPQLVNDTPYRYENAPKPPLLPDHDFYRTRHQYRLPEPNGSPWMAVGAKAFSNSVLDNTNVKTGLFSYTYWAQVPTGGLVAAMSGGAGQPAAAADPAAVDLNFVQAYAFPVSLASDSCTSSNCEIRSEGGGNTDGSNFIMVKAGAVPGRDLRVEPYTSDSKLHQYAAEASWSTALPPVTAKDVGTTGFRYEYTATVSTGDIVKAYHLDLPPNVQLRIATTVTIGMSDTGTVTTELDVPTASAVTHLFPPDRDAYGKSDNHLSVEDHEAILSPIPMGGSWGIVLELPGDKTAFSYCGHNGQYCDGEPENPDRNPADRTVEVVFAIQVCPARTIPDGEVCQIVPTPDWNNTDFWRTVGPYRIYTPAGFVDNCNEIPGQTCTRSRDANNVAYTPVVTWGDQIERALILARTPVTSYILFFREVTDLYLYGSPISILGKLDAEGLLAPGLYLADAVVEASYYDDADIYSGWINGGPCYDDCLMLPLSDFDQVNYTTRLQPGVTEPEFRIRMPQDDVNETVTQYAEFSATILRPINTVNGVEDKLLNVTWTVQAEGYRGRFDTPQGTGPLSISVVGPVPPSPAPVASLTYEFGPVWEGHYNEKDALINEFRNNNGMIVQPANMGGAWNYVDYVLLPFGKSPSGNSGLAMCGAFCGDIRAADDTWAAPKREWKMPDVLVNQLPNTVMVSSPGQLDVYSTDHPSTIGATNDTYGFSFKTFGAKVELVDGVCPDGSSEQPVSLIKGTTSLSLPGMDPKADPKADNSAIPSITASFVLCENSLRQVSLTFRYPPGIPVAAPPVLYVDMIGGTVTIGPEHVVISIDVGFYIGTAGPSQIMKGVATLTLDTRGLFDLQVTGRVMGAMDGEGHLWVAWNPLDLGVSGQVWLPNKNDWFMKGFIYAHVWRGSGWQNKYPWLAGNDDFHLTASLQAEFKINKGAVIDKWPLVIPPGEIRIGIELSFGQFCDNDACTEHEWGIKGKVTIIGFDVGIYVSLECPFIIGAAIAPPVALLCASFILGSDDHLLIDQYGGNGPPNPLAANASVEGISQAEPMSLEEANHITVADPQAPQVDQTFTVKPTTASILVAFGWVRGAPDFALERPDGQILTAATAVGLGAVVSTTANSVIYGINNPQDGEWTAHITNATETDDYRMAYFANKATPQLAFTAPSGVVEVAATGNSTTEQTYRIEWTPPDNADQLRMTLFYSATVPNATSPTYQYGGVIREEIDPSTGFYDWDLSHLSTGDYRIYATLQDDKGAQVSELGEDQYVGITTSIAQGTLRYTDHIGPPPPDANSVTFVPTGDDLLVCWDVNAAHDLSEYFITFAVTDIRYFVPDRIVRERALATVTAGPGARQCHLISGLTPNDATISFPPGDGGLAARDASGNLSGYIQPTSFTMPPSDPSRFPPAAPVLAGSASGGTANLMWEDNATSYELFYARETYAGPHQPAGGASEGTSPIAVGGGFGGNYAVNGLEPGHWYSFAVRSIGPAPASTPSLLSNYVWLLISSGVDSNGDGCPDDWENAHAPYDGNSNPDGDGLTTAQECKIGTNPNVPDTDGDGIIEGVETATGTNPLDPTSRPEFPSPQMDRDALPPTMALAQSHLSFVAFTQGPNPLAKNVAVTNIGSGDFTPTVTDNQPWLLPSVNGKTVVVNVNADGLALGNYTGLITVGADPSSTLGSPQTIIVDLSVVAGNPVPVGGDFGLFMPQLMKKK